MPFAHLLAVLPERYIGIFDNDIKMFTQLAPIFSFSPEAAAEAGEGGAEAGRGRRVPPTAASRPNSHQS